MSDYTVYVTPRAWRELKALPGHMRQRLRREIDALAATPRPSTSKALTLPEGVDAADLPAELRRLRIDRWRVVYAVTDADAVVDVLTVKKRPPYDYGNLSELLEDV